MKSDMADIENIDSDNSPGYWLFYAQRCVSYAFAETMRKHCMERGKPYVVTPPQWGALLLLYTQDSLTIGTLSQKRGIDTPTVTGIIKRLEQAGLVERRHDHEDRRVVRTYLTDEGRDITQSLLPIVQSFNDDMLNNFSNDDRQMILSMLQRIIANVSNETLGTGDRFNLLPERFVRQEYLFEN
jgi:DNA-binding MarR family transcriptional regulator